MQILILAFMFFMVHVFLRFPYLRLMRWEAWFYMYIAGTFFDIISTYFGLNNLGIEAESNVPARFLFERIGIAEGLFIHGFLTLSLFLTIGVLWGRHHQWGIFARCIIFVIALGRLAAGINNLIVA